MKKKNLQSKLSLKIHDLAALSGNQHSSIKGGVVKFTAAANCTATCFETCISRTCNITCDIVCTTGPV